MTFLATLLLLSVTAIAADIQVMTSGAFAAAYLELIPQFESATKHKVITVTTTMGTGSDSIPSRLQRGDPVDIVIVADAALKESIKDGKVLPGTRVPLAKSGIGMAVRAGAPKPDIRGLRVTASAAFCVVFRFEPFTLTI